MGKREAKTQANASSVLQGLCPGPSEPVLSQAPQILGGSLLFFFLIKTSRFIIQLINQEVLMSIQQLMISVKMKLEIHYISAQGNFPMYSKTYTAVFVLI